MFFKIIKVLLKKLAKKGGYVPLTLRDSQCRCSRNIMIICYKREYQLFICLLRHCVGSVSFLFNNRNITTINNLCWFSDSIRTLYVIFMNNINTLIYYFIYF